MKKMILVSAVLGHTSLTAGCAYRSPEMWRDDVSKVLATKQADMKACYDGVLKGTPTAGGKVAIAFEVETEGGKIQNVTVETAKSTAPPEVQDCVKKNVEGLVISPPDKRLGQGTAEFDFQPGAPPAT
jgi:uncharacterized protein with FMN-binding domain